MTDLTETMFARPEMTAAFSDAARVQRMLDFEAALARGEAKAGLMPARAAEAIAAKCRVDLFDLEALFRDAAQHATPVVPLVRMLTKLVDEQAQRFVHWGATSQDAVDTGVMLQIREGLDLLAGRLADIAHTCAALADRYRHTPMPGRTLLQHAVPITFGLKAARWLALSTRLLRLSRDLRGRVLVVQFGGAAGTLAALGAHGIQVMELLAQELDLDVPDLPWHTERDRIAEIAGALGVIAGAMAKIATDLALLSQTEVGEVATTGGRSSTMPHKRNPVEATAALACARLALAAVPAVLAAGVQEHERAAGAWQAEWQAVPDLFRRTSGAVEWVHRALVGLHVDEDRMAANLDATHGLIMAEALTMALAAHVGRHEAYRLVQAASDRAAASRQDLQEVVAADRQIGAVLPADALAQAFDVSRYLGSADAFIDRALQGFRAAAPRAAAR